METTMNYDSKYDTRYHNEIMELSYIYTTDGFVVESDSFKIKHTAPCTADAYEVHGIADIECQTEISEVVKKIFIPLKNVDVIVGHNISFDIGRIKAWNNEPLNVVIDSKKQFCTMKDIPELWKTVFSGTTRKNKKLHKAYSSLWDCEAYLINDLNYTEEKLQKEFKKVFPKFNEGKHHSSPYDTFICYLIYKHLGNAK